MRSRLLLFAVLVFAAASASAAGPFYRIVDLASGKSVDVPRYLNDEAVDRDEVIGSDGRKKLFYTFRYESAKDCWTLQTASYDGQVVSQKPLPGFDCQSYDHGFPSIACAISPNGQRLLYWAALFDGFSPPDKTPANMPKENIRVYDIATGERTALFDAGGGAYWLGWEHDDMAIASVSAGVVLLDMNKKEARVLLPGKSPGHCSISPDLHWFAFFETGQPVMLLNLTNAELKTVSAGPLSDDDHLCWSPDSTLLAYSAQGAVKIYSANSGKEVMSVNPGSPKNMFFLKEDKLAVKPWWTTNQNLNAASIYTYDIPGAQASKLPQEFLGNAVALAGNEKVLCLFDPTIDELADHPLRRYGTTSERVIGTILGIGEE